MRWCVCRLEWGRYFESEGLPFLFFSAKLEQERIDAMERDMATHTEGDEAAEDTEGEVEVIEGEPEAEEEEEEEEGAPVDAFAHRCRVIGRDELIDFLIGKQEELVPAPVIGEEEGSVVEDDAPTVRPVMVGMVGYPNVGKSSTINALLGASTLSHSVKRVSVGCTPGKTKHFQVCALVCLCVCPCVTPAVCVCRPSPCVPK